MPHLPLTTLVMLTWNAKEYIRITLDSLFKGGSPFHLIVVDNGSNKTTVEFLKKEKYKHGFELLLLRENVGVWKARKGLLHHG